jgi:hypothetical protein
MGNLSPHIVKQLGFTLLLELQADLLVIDETTSAGIGDERLATRAQLQEKIELSTSLIFSSDFNLIREVTNESLVLHYGRLYGPFNVEQAIDHFHQLPREDLSDKQLNYIFDPNRPPTLSRQSLSQFEVGERLEEDGGFPFEDIESGLPSHTSERTRFISGPSWSLLSIRVDGNEYNHANHSLLRRPNDSINICVEMVSNKEQAYSGGVFSLHGGNTGLEIGRYVQESSDILIGAQQKYILEFKLTISDFQEDFFGLTFCPHYRKKHVSLGDRMKILIVGVGHKHKTQLSRTLEIHNYTFKRKVKNASINPVP